MNQIEDNILNAVLPEKTKSYSPIAHGTIIKNIENYAEDLNLEIVDRSYQTDKLCNKVIGKYTLSLKDDDIGCMIAFQNSYDKSMSAKFAIGASVFICSNGMLIGDRTIKRKHTGTGPAEVIDYMKDSMNSSIKYFEESLTLRDDMKTINLSENAIIELLGEMFWKEDLIRSTQLSLIKNEYNKPTFDHKVDKNNLWNIYNLITDSIERRSHPTLYMNQNEKVTDLIKTKFL